MNRNWRWAPVLVISCAWAEPPIWDSLRTSWIQHPRLQALRNERSMLASDSSLAGRRPPLRLEGELGNFAGSGDAKGLEQSVQSLWITRDFPTTDLRRAEKSLAATDVAGLDLDTLRVRRELLFQARRHWEAWLVARWNASLIDSQVGILGAMHAEAVRGLAQGKTPRWETALLEADRKRAEAMAARWKSEASREWRNLTWFTTTRPPEPVAAPAPEPIASRATGTNLDSLRHFVEGQQALAQWNMAQARDKPVVEAGAGLIRDQATGDLAMGIRIALPLPWSRPSWDQAQARARRVAAESRRTAADLERTRKRSTIASQLEEASKALTQLLDLELPARQEALRLLEAASLQGGVDRSTLWETRRSLWASEHEHIDRLAQLRSLELERLELEGNEP